MKRRKKERKRKNSRRRLELDSISGILVSLAHHLWQHQLCSYSDIWWFGLLAYSNMEQVGGFTVKKCVVTRTWPWGMYGIYCTCPRAYIPSEACPNWLVAISNHHECCNPGRTTSRVLHTWFAHFFISLFPLPVPSFRPTGREPGRFWHVHDDVLCVVLCALWA